MLQKSTALKEDDAGAPVERLFGLFRRMLLIREFEEAAAEALKAELISGPVHQSVGQEAVAVGVCANLRRDDLLQSNHRGHGHALAKGADPVAMMKELFGRVGGTNGGKGGSMHIADFSVGMLGANGILADGVTLAVGAAHSVDLKGEDKVVTVFVGDGTTNRGPFYEGLNWAKVFNLPLLIVCENNGYASSTLTKAVTAGGGPAVRARAFDIPTLEVDGNDLPAVDAAAAELLIRVRRGEGPQFLHALTYRIKGHVSRDLLSYRAEGESEAMSGNEPISRAEVWLTERGVSSERLQGAREEARRLMAEAVQAAKAAPFPDPRLAYSDIQDLGAPTWPN